MTDKLFISQVKQYREIAKTGKSITIPLEDFDKLVEIAEQEANYVSLSSDCNCYGDHYGMATNPLCPRHGDNDKRRAARQEGK